MEYVSPAVNEDGCPGISADSVFKEVVEIVLELEVGVVITDEGEQITATLVRAAIKNKTSTRFAKTPVLLENTECVMLVFITGA